MYTGEQFRDITRSYAWAAGAYDGTIRVRCAERREGRQADRPGVAEAVHAPVATLAPRNVPAWLNEGLATALESDSLEWARTRIAGAAPMSLAALRTSFGRLTGAQAQLAYATSALAVRQLLDEAGGFAIANLLRDLGEGVEFDEVGYRIRHVRGVIKWRAPRRSRHGGSPRPGRPLRLRFCRIAGFDEARRRRPRHPRRPPR